MHAFCALPAPSAHTPVQTYFGAAECKVNEGEDKGGSIPNQVVSHKTSCNRSRQKAAKWAKHHLIRELCQKLTLAQVRQGKKNNTLQKKKGLSFGSLKKLSNCLSYEHDATMKKKNCFYFWSSYCFFKPNVCFLCSTQFSCNFTLLLKNKEEFRLWPIMNLYTRSSETCVCLNMCVRV